MGVVRIDDALEKEIAGFIRRPENRYRYPSKSTFLNIIINDFFVSQRTVKKKQARENDQQPILKGTKRGKK